MSAPGANRLPVLVQEIGTAHQGRRSAADTIEHAIGAFIQAADRRLDELGYHGPKGMFGGQA